MNITPFFHRPSSTWSYVIADVSTRQAAVLDTALDFDAASGRLGDAPAMAIQAHLQDQGLTLEWILETHAHADHLSAAAWFKARHPGARTGIGRGITAVQSTFKQRLALEPDFATDGSQFDALFDDGQRFSIGGLEVEVISVPGHTSDSVAYRIGDAVFVGDTLFAPDYGTARCDFPGGDAARLHASIHRLYALPDATRVFLCHDYALGGRDVVHHSSIGEQKRDNVHLRQDTGSAEFVLLRESRDAGLAVPALLYPAVQVNIRAGALPPAEAGRHFLKLPIRPEHSP